MSLTLNDLIEIYKLIDKEFNELTYKRFNERMTLAERDEFDKEYEKIKKLSKDVSAEYDRLTKEIQARRKN